ncbi:hypothetical protein RHECNPAF_12600119 [Rhizobium etli CNPAF512]|nr:hypothetical protein RHECNPAF_12600119 [Rhizobium etli CNPAF512]
MHGRFFVLEKGPDAVARHHRQEFVESLPVGRKRLVPADQVFRLGDDFHRPVFVAAGGSKNIDEQGDAVVGEFSGQFGVLKLLLLRHSAASAGRGVVFEIFFILNRFGLVRVYRSRCRFCQANAGAAAIFRNEKYTSLFQGALGMPQRSLVRKKPSGFETGNRRLGYLRGFRQIPLGPGDESTRGTALGWRKHEYPPGIETLIWLWRSTMKM